MTNTMAMATVTDRSTEGVHTPPGYADPGAVRREGMGGGDNHKRNSDYQEDEIGPVTLKK